MTVTSKDLTPATRLKARTLMQEAVACVPGIAIATAPHQIWSAPTRIKLSRAKDWRKPANTIVVSRPSKWGNPFHITSCIEIGFASDIAEARRVCVEAFEDWLYKGNLSPWWFGDSSESWAWMREHLEDLVYRNLACWCPLDQPCHADVLLRAADALRS